MSDAQKMQQGMPLRSGYFDSEAFKRKSHSILVLKTGIAGLHFHVDPNMAVGGSWLDPGYDIRIYSIKNYTQPSPQIGFRVIARKVKTEKVEGKK